MASFLNDVTVSQELGSKNTLNSSSGKSSNVASTNPTMNRSQNTSSVQKQTSQSQSKQKDTSQQEKSTERQSQEKQTSIDNEKFELLLSRLNTVQPDNVRQGDLKIFNFVKQNWDNFTREQKDKLHQNRIALAFIFNPQKELKIQHEENQDIVARDIEQTNTICSVDPKFINTGFKIKEDNNENVIKDEKGHLLFLKGLVESLDQITADEISGEKSGKYNFPNEKVYVFANKEEDEDFYYCLYPSFAYSDKQLVIRIEYEKGKLPKDSDVIVTEKKDKKLITTYFKYGMKKIKFMLENLNNFWETEFKDPKKIFVDLFNDVLTEQGSFKEKYDEEKVGIVKKRQEIAKVFKENIIKELGRNFEAPEERAEDLFDYHIYTTLKIPIKKQGENETDEEYKGRKEKAEAQENALFDDKKIYHFILKTELKDGKLTIEEEPKYASWDKEKTEKGLKRLLDLNKNKNISYELIEISSYNDLVRLNDQLKTTKENLQFNLDKIKDLKLEDILKEIDKVVPEKDALTLLRDTIPGYDFLQTRSLKSNLSVIEDIKKFIEYFNAKVNADNNIFKDYLKEQAFSDFEFKNVLIKRLPELFIDIFYKKILENFQSMSNELTKYSKEYAKEMLESVYQEALRSNDKKFQTAKKAEIEEAKGFVRGIFVDLESLQVDIDENISNVESHLTSDQSLSEDKDENETQGILGKKIYNEDEVSDIINDKDSKSLNDEFNLNKKLLDDLKEYTEIIERKTNSNIHIIDLTNEADYEKFKTGIKKVAESGKNKFYLIKRRRHEDSTHQNKILLQFVMTFRKKVFYKEIKDLKDILSNIKSMLSLVKENVDNNSKDLVERKFKYAQRRFKNFIDDLFDEFDEKKVKEKLDAIDPNDYEKKHEFLKEKITQNENFREAMSQFIKKENFNFVNDIFKGRYDQEYKEDYVFFKLKKKLENSGNNSNDDDICKLSFFSKQNYEKNLKKEFIYKFSIPENTNGLFDDSTSIKETMLDISFDNNLLKILFTDKNEINDYQAEQTGINHLIIVNSFKEIFLKPSIGYVKSKLKGSEENSKKYYEYYGDIKIPEIEFDNEKTLVEPDIVNKNTPDENNSKTIEKKVDISSNKDASSKSQENQEEKKQEEKVSQPQKQNEGSKVFDDSKLYTSTPYRLVELERLGSDSDKSDITTINDYLKAHKEDFTSDVIEKIINALKEISGNNNTETWKKTITGSRDFNADKFLENFDQKASRINIDGIEIYFEDVFSANDGKEPYFIFALRKKTGHISNQDDFVHGIKIKLKLSNIWQSNWASSNNNDKLNKLMPQTNFHCLADKFLKGFQNESSLNEKSSKEDDLGTEEENTISKDKFEDLNTENLKQYNQNIEKYVNFINDDSYFKEMLKKVYPEIQDGDKLQKYKSKLIEIKTFFKDYKNGFSEGHEILQTKMYSDQEYPRLNFFYTSFPQQKAGCYLENPTSNYKIFFQVEFAQEESIKNIYKTTFAIFELLVNKIIKGLGEIKEESNNLSPVTTNESKSILKILGQKLLLEEIQKSQDENPHLDFSYFKSQKKEIQALIKQYEKEEDKKQKKTIEKKIRQKQKEISNQISLQSVKNFVNNIKSLRNANNENSQALVKQMGKRLGFEPSPLEFSLQSLNKFKNMSEFSRVISNIVLTNIMLQLTQLNTIYTIFSNDQIDESVIRDSFMQLENDFKRLVKSLQEKEVTKKFEDLSSKIEENFGADSSVYLETKDTYERVMSYYQKQFKSLNDFKQSLSEFWENYSKIEKEEEKINERKNMISQFIEIRDSKEIKQIYKIYLVNNSFFNEKLQGIISENSKLSYNEILTSHGYETFESIYQKEKQIFDKTFKKCNEVLGKALGQGRLGKLFDDLEKIKTNLENTKVKPEEEQKQGQEKKEENTQNTQVKQKTVSNKNTKPGQEKNQDKTEETSVNKTESKKIKQGLKLLNNDTQLKIYQRKN